MSHPNHALIKSAYDAFGQGDIPSVLAVFDKDIRWHVPGQSALSGDYNGPAEVLAFFTKCMELSDGTLRIDVHDIAANDAHVFVLCTVSATRHNLFAEFLEVHLWRIVAGRVVEFREFQGDELAENKFWAQAAL